MGDRTGIEWTDATWNPTTGCDKVSPGCDHCYAMTVAPRLKAMHASKGRPDYQLDGDPRTSGPGFGLMTYPDRLDQPLRWKRPRRIFVNSMSDLFHKDVPDEFIAKVWAVMALAPQHTFQILTKRHGRMRSLLNSRDFQRLVRDAWAGCDKPDGITPGKCICGHSKSGHNGLGYCRIGECACGIGSFVVPLAHGRPLPNVWLGVSVEDQARADLRIPALLATPAAVRFLSCEPLLGPVDLLADRGVDGYLARVGVGPAVGIGWVIVGGESGAGARPMHPEWARQLRDQCAAAGVPFLFKQWGEWLPTFEGRHRVTYDGRLLEPQDGCLMSNEELVKRVGKKAAGRTLDGRTHDEYPEETR